MLTLLLIKIKLIIAIKNINKITLFATTDLNFDQRLQRISFSLATTEHEVILVGRENDNSPILKKTSFKQKRLKCIINKGFLFYFEFNVRIAFFLFRNKTNIVVANDLDTVIGVYFGTLFSNTKRIFDAHEYFTEVPELNNRKIKKNIWKWIEKKYVPLFDVHYTVNDSLANLFKENLNLKFEVIRNVPKQTTVKKIYKNNDKYILYQGALNKGRGLSEIIIAMQNVNCILKIAGSGDIENELITLVKELKLENKIFFLGKLEPLELKKVTEKAYIGLNLLENNSLNYYYSLANKFFDYIQAEIPQICMNFPEYKILNKEYEVALLVKNLDKQILVKAIKNLDNENFYTSLKNNCRKAKNIYNWENEEKKLITIYNNKE